MPMAEQPRNQTPSTADAGAAEVRDRPVEEPRQSGTAELPGTADVATDPVREVITVDTGAADVSEASSAGAADTDWVEVTDNDDAGTAGTAGTDTGGTAGTSTV